MVPPGVATTLGGGCLDLSVDAAVASDVLDCKIALRSAGSEFPMAVGGRPDKIEIDKSGALFGVLGGLG